MPLPRAPSTRPALVGLQAFRERQATFAARVVTWPDTTASQPWESESWSFEVAGKRFGYGLYQHMGDDGRSGLVLKAAPGVQEALVGDDPDHYWVPAFIGRHGWVGVRLDLEEPDWEAVERLAGEAWRLAAPKRLLQRPDAPR